MSDHPWLEVARHREGAEGGRRESALYKITDPSSWEQGHMDNPKGRVSPGEGLVKMVRVLPVRPAGGKSSSGYERGCSTGGGASEEQSPSWHQGV